MSVVVLASAGLVIRALVKLRRETATQLNSVTVVVQGLTGRLSDLEEHSRLQAEEIHNLRLALDRQKHGVTGASLDAIKAARNGASAAEIARRYALRPAESQLLVAVYGSTKSDG